MSDVKRYAIDSMGLVIEAEGGSMVAFTDYYRITAWLKKSWNSADERAANAERLITRQTKEITALRNAMTALMNAASVAAEMRARDEAYAALNRPPASAAESP